jgi:prevent-host-death family protein
MKLETIGVRDLKNRTTLIVRAVRAGEAEYIVTVRGAPVAVIRPYTPADEGRLRQARIEEQLAGLEQLAHDIGRAWTSPKSGVELVEEQRRD